MLTNGAAPARAQCRQQRAGNTERRGKIHREQPVEQAIVGLRQGPEAGNARVIDKDIAAPPNLSSNSTEDVVDGGAVGEIHCVRHECRTAEFLRQPPEAIGVAIEAVYRCALRDQLPRDRPANAARRAGDHRAQARERLARRVQFQTTVRNDTPCAPT